MRSPLPFAPVLLATTMLVLGGVHCAHAAKATTRNVAKIKIERHGGAQRIEVERMPDGRYSYVVEAADGTKQTRTPEEFSSWLLEPEASTNWLARLFNISSAVGIAWVALGLLGQALFTGRMLVQWIASERIGRSTIPTVFWWLSLGGSVMLVAYFLWRRDLVGVLGQSTGCFIYLRNLRLIYRKRP
jgi:lipid-A-disaccharide synthase-like uncharacterized protein